MTRSRLPDDVARLERSDAMLGATPGPTLLADRRVWVIEDASSSSNRP